ncbi:MAG: glycine dehydrogenase [Myxococcota bacterium]|jgi:glycine dehydrogenase
MSRPTDVFLTPTDSFARRHIGPSDADVRTMLDALGHATLDTLSDAAVPASIRAAKTPDLGPGLSEHMAVKHLRAMADKNQVMRSYLGMGYYDCITPGVILRNILEDPGWYTQYTPYQAEIAQGRLEMLFNYQTMVSDLTGLPVSNASLLDEATAAAEAMAMAKRVLPRKSTANTFFVSRDCHPQTIAVTQTRAEALGIDLIVGDHREAEFGGDVFGCLVQYPATDGTITDYRSLCERAHEGGATVTMATDLLALTLLTPPGELGADIAIGSSQRFGVPLGYGGPHAAFFATREQWMRQVPGRIIGLSKDANGEDALRMALQTREQHIRRDRATSNICTAQVLLAVIAGAFGVYHGPDGLRAIGLRTHRLTTALREGLKRLGHDVGTGAVFDTLRITPKTSADAVIADALALGINLRRYSGGDVGVALDSTVTGDDLDDLLRAFGDQAPDAGALLAATDAALPEGLTRTSQYLTHPVFHSHRSETEMLRYLTRLRGRDLSLAQSMIPLGSCTMKLNATSEMIPVTWPEFGAIHPFAPVDQATGYAELFDDLERWLAEATGFSDVSLQPNAGSQGEYAGLLVIRAWHRDRNEAHRDVCLIPTSAHGTNPASAVMAGMKVVGVKCDSEGNIDVADLTARAEQHADSLAALMITYPSTHGVFETSVREICDIIHANGGQVYLDGANMNAQVGLCRPGDYGADVCHLNLHKTFCIPHGGGGPGMGPIGVQPHLAPFLPGHPVIPMGGERAIGPVSAAPWGSPSILPIPWMYIAMMGTEGLKKATQVAILSANYIAKKLEPHYPVLFRGANGLVAHECIVDVRPLKGLAGVQVDDVAKRLMDYGFHAPTMSWPVPGTMMIEPTESESLAEVDRFCDAMIAIRHEAQDIADRSLDRKDNILRNSPHTAAVLTADSWDKNYSRQQAGYPTQFTRDSKFWPPVGRVDNAYGDRHLVCTCPSVEEYAES